MPNSVWRPRASTFCCDRIACWHQEKGIWEERCQIGSSACVQLRRVCSERRPHAICELITCVPNNLVRCFARNIKTESLVFLSSESWLPVEIRGLSLWDESTRLQDALSQIQMQNSLRTPTCSNDLLWTQDEGFLLVEPAAFWCIWLNISLNTPLLLLWSRSAVAEPFGDTFVKCSRWLTKRVFSSAGRCSVSTRMDLKRDTVQSLCAEANTPRNLSSSHIAYFYQGLSFEESTQKALWPLPTESCTQILYLMVAGLTIVIWTMHSTEPHSVR